MEFYFTKNSYISYFYVIINKLYVEIIRVDSRKKVFSDNVNKIFIGEHLLDDIFNKDVEKGNSILLELDKYKYMYIGDCIYTFRTTDEIIKYSSNIGNNSLHQPLAYGQKNIYFLVGRYEYIPYNTTENENIKNMDLTFDAYYHIYNTNDGERNKILNLNLIASRFYDDDIDNENFFNYEEVENVNNNLLIIDDEDEDEIIIYNGNNELVKIFKLKKNVVFV